MLTDAQARTYHQSTKWETRNNVIKGGLLYWLSGVEPVYYERKITPWFTIQGGIGLTSRDFMADLTNLWIYALNDGVSANNYADYHERKVVVSIYSSLQPKFYTNITAMNGFYISPKVEFKRYNYKANLVDPNQTGLFYLPNQYYKEHFTVVDFTANVGWQWMFDPLTLELNLGAGVRKYWQNRLDIEEDNTTGLYTNGVNNFNGIRPTFNIELNLGGFF